jgi:uncharacterized protein YerC
MGAAEPELAGNQRVRDLCAALDVCDRDRDLMLRFLRDLLSHHELATLGDRWAIARSLLDGRTQTATAASLALSIKTVGKVAQRSHGPFATGGFAEVHRRIAPGG